MAKRARPLRFLFENSLFLVGGAAVGLLWANLAGDSYTRFVQLDILNGLSLKHFVNDVLMALFFALAAKEVWEAVLPGGALSNPRKAATPLLATLGGMAGPAAVYILGVYFFAPESDLMRGWAVPCATDIAFSYMVARLIFGPRHVAIPFLLLVAIADDALGLIILATVYPQGEPQLLWLLLSAAAVVLGLLFRRLRLQSFWWYLLGPGVLSWFGFHHAHLHAALGLLPIIPTMPHAHTDLGLFVRQELGRKDTLSAFEHWWKNPVELILGLFGLTNAGVAFGSIGVGTYLVLAALVVGKPLGITLFTLLGEKVFKLEKPEGMNYRHVVSLGMIAGLGFTVALFMSTAAFPEGEYPPELLDSVKMGALLSFGVAFSSYVISRLIGVKRQRDEPAPP